jgi:hypothetical protein
MDRTGDETCRLKEELRMTRGLGLVIVAVAFVGCGGIEVPTGGDMGSGGVQAKFSSLYGDYFSNCGSCHSPSGPGRTSDIEKTLDFTSQSTAYSTLKTGDASGLVGNQMACNGVNFVGATPAASLIVAVLDSSVRQTYDSPTKPACDSTAITDETVKVGSAPSSQFLTALKQWITDGAQNN